MESLEDAAAHGQKALLGVVHPVPPFAGVSVQPTSPYSGLVLEIRSRYRGFMETRVVICQSCGRVVLRRGVDLTACARQAIEHAARSGCDPSDALIQPLAVGRS